MPRCTMLVLLLASCSGRAGSRPDSPNAEPATADSPAAPATPAAAPDAATAPPANDAPILPPPPDAPTPEAAPAVSPDCDALHRELLAALATLPSPCSTNADCVCFVGGIEGFTDCGGVSDAPTAERIYKIVRAYEELQASVGQCPHGPTVECAPSICEASCIEGRCR